MMIIVLLNINSKDVFHCQVILSSKYLVINIIV